MQPKETEKWKQAKQNYKTEAQIKRAERNFALDPNYYAGFRSE